MDDATRKQVVAAWQQRKQDEIEHPFMKEQIPLGLVPYTQALLLARFLFAAAWTPIRPFSGA